VADPRQLLGGGQAGGAGADHGDLLAGLGPGRLGRDPAHFPALVDEEVLDGLDAHRLGVDAQGAGGLAGGGADAAGELGEIVGGVQHLQGLPPVAPVGEVVPVRDDVVHRATVAAERDAAVHAAGALDLGGLVAEGVDELLVIAQALVDGFVHLGLAFKLQETSHFSHFRRPLSVGRRRFP
jgi:hypothetical protein